MCLVVLVIGFALRLMTGKESGEKVGDQVVILYEYRHSYIGDASKVAGILDQLELAQYRGSLALQTDNEPYELTVFYHLADAALTDLELEQDLQKNAAIIFALVDNAGLITFQVEGALQGEYRFARQAVEESFPITDFSTAVKDVDSFRNFCHQAGTWVTLQPKSYTPAMSSTPGMKLVVASQEEYSEIAYTASFGEFISWAPDDGAIKSLGVAVRVPQGKTIYWTPAGGTGEAEEPSEVKIIVDCLGPTGDIAVSRALVLKNVDGFFTVN